MLCKNQREIKSYNIIPGAPSPIWIDPILFCQAGRDYIIGSENNLEELEEKPPPKQWSDKRNLSPKAGMGFLKMIQTLPSLFLFRIRTERREACSQLQDSASGPWLMAVHSATIWNYEQVVVIPDTSEVTIIGRPYGHVSKIYI